MNAKCYTFYNGRDFVTHSRLIQNEEGTRAHKDNLNSLLEQIKQYMTTRECRRRHVLAYFGEHLEDDCDFCDNCCEDEDDPMIMPSIKQDINEEAKMVIRTIDSMGIRSFGVGMYVDILRGSNRAAITPEMKRGEYYGSGKEKTVEWWKEVIEILLNQGYLKKVYKRGSSFGMFVVQTTGDGTVWANLSDIGLDIGVGKQKPLPEMMMTNIR